MDDGLGPLKNASPDCVMPPTIRETHYEKMATKCCCCHVHQSRATYQCSAAHLACVVIRQVVGDHNPADTIQ